VRPVEGDYIRKKGYEIYASSFRRYNTLSKPISEDRFQNNLYQVIDHREYWIVLDRASGRPIGYAQNRKYKNEVSLEVIKLDPEFLKFYSSYALIFEMTRYYLNELGLAYVSNGTRSLSHATNFENLLITKFRYRRAYCRLNIAYSPITQFIVSLFFPFKTIISKTHNTFNQKLSVLLAHEQIKRSFE